MSKKHIKIKLIFKEEEKLYDNLKKTDKIGFSLLDHSQPVVFVIIYLHKVVIKTIGWITALGLGESHVL